MVIDERRKLFPAASAMGVSARGPWSFNRHVPPMPCGRGRILRSPAVSAVIGWLEKIDDRTFRRLQLAAETGDSLGCILRPPSCRAEPSWASARLAVEGVPSDNYIMPGRSLRVEVLYRRGGFGGKAVVVELGEEGNEGRRVSAARGRGLRKLPDPCTGAAIMHSSASPVFPKTTGQSDPMPPNKRCPNCHQQVEDWHVEWYKAEARALYQGRSNGLPIMRAARWISTRADRAGTPWCPISEAERGQGSGMGTAGGKLHWWNITRISFNLGAGESVCQLLASPAGPTSRLERKSQESRAVIMLILTPKEKDFLDVFLHEATTSPFFRGPATKALSSIGVEYHDISYIAWAYNREVPRTSVEWGRAAAVAPPLPWADRDTALQRDQEIKRLWEEQEKTAEARKHRSNMPGIDDFFTGTPRRMAGRV